MAGARRRVRKLPRIRPFDLARYIGSEERGILPKYTDVELMILSAGTVGLLASLVVPPSIGVRAAARAVSSDNRRQFHRRQKK